MLIVVRLSRAGSAGGCCSSGTTLRRMADLWLGDDQ
jgi:hypothetical protein